MSSILSTVAFGKNKDFNSSLKNLFSIYLKKNIYELLALKMVRESVNLKARTGDMMSFVPLDKEQELIEQGYKATTVENYITQFYNCIDEIRPTKDIKIVDFKKSLRIGDMDYFFRIRENSLIILNENFELFIECPYKIKEFFSFEIDLEGFVYISLLDLNNKNRFIKTHLALNFIENLTKEDRTLSLDEIECIFDIEVSEKINTILSAGDDFIQYLNEFGETKELLLGKKYYFAKDENLFFNIVDNKKYDNVIQLEHLHMYDWISILGLNDFTDENGMKLSTANLKNFNKLIKFRFGDTKNGLLNFYDFFTEKDYHIDVMDCGITVTGNFINEYKKGKFKLLVRAYETTENNEVKYTFILSQDSKVIKEITSKTVNRTAYFCNLKIEFISYEYHYDTLTIDLDIKDDYSAKAIYSAVSKDILTENFNKNIMLDQVLRNENPDKKQLLEIGYKDRNLVVKNFIKDSTSRRFDKDLKIKLIEEDGTPTLLWKQIKDKDYFLTLNEYTVSKTIRPIRKIKKLLKTGSRNFTIKKINSEV